jgi:PIN domain nuclease of toxin-antitoxin system
MILLDTCTLLWLGSDQSQLSAPAKELIADNAGSIFISSISAFEIALKHRKHKLRLPTAPRAWVLEALSSQGIEEIPVDVLTSIVANELPPLHDDPFDRVIIATAQINGYEIITPDELIHRYPGVTVRW